MSSSPPAPHLHYTSPMILPRGTLDHPADVASSGPPPEPTPAQPPSRRSQPRPEQGLLFDLELSAETPPSPVSSDSQSAAPVQEPATEASMSCPASEAPETAEVAEVPEQILSLRIDQLEPLPAALRRPGSERQRERLKASLRRGQIQPIQVRALDDGRFGILDGHDVVEVLTGLGHSEVRALVRHISDPVEALRYVMAGNFARKNWKPGDLVVLCPAMIQYMGDLRYQYELAALLGIDHATFSEYKGYGLRLTPGVLTRAGLDPVCAADQLRSISRDDLRWITEPKEDLGVAIRLSYHVHGKAPADVGEKDAKKHRPKERPVSEVTRSKRLKNPKITATARPRTMTRKQIEAHLAEYADELRALCPDEDVAAGSGESGNVSAAAAHPVVDSGASFPPTHNSGL